MGRSSPQNRRQDPVLAKIACIQRAARKGALVRGYVSVVIAAVALVFLGVLLDHTWALQESGRAVFLAIFLLVCGAGLLAASAFSLFARVSRLFVARQIEHAQPALKNSLISYLQCRGDPRVPAEVKRLLRERANRHVRDANPRLLARRERSARLVWVLVALLTLLGLYALLSPKSAVLSARRLFAPHAPILPPTRTRITGVRPGSAWLLRGDGALR